MPPTQLILFDDARAQSWEPFALTRPVAELMFGALTQRARAVQTLGLPCRALLAADHLAGWEEAGAPPVGTFAEAPTAGQRIFLSSRAVPAFGAAGVLLRSGALQPGPLTIGGEVVGWSAPEGSPNPAPEFFADPAAEAGAGAGRQYSELGGSVLGNVWELITRGPEQLESDLAALLAQVGSARLPESVYRLGNHPVVFGDGVRVEPGVVFDCSAGAVWLDEGVTVRAFTRLSGPAYVGPRSTVLGGSLEAVAIGPVCRVRGEVAESTLLGYVNKAHDGHLGHAYLGRWVNLGAETTNSDLKNNYDNVRIWTPAGERDTGTIKFGSLLGDHVKTGIGTLLNTGTVVGAGSNLYGAAMPPTFVPPFSWGTGSELVPYRLPKFLEVAERAMGRREVPLTAGTRQTLERAWERARGGQQ